MRFFRWLYAPDIPQSKRSRPPIMENVPKLRRKEISIYKPTDLWIEEDDAFSTSTVLLRGIDAGMLYLVTLGILR